MKDSPDADASFSLLADVRGLKAWLRQESLWGHDQRAIAVLTKLDAVLVGCDRKEAKRLSQVGRWAERGQHEEYLWYNITSVD